ncbi:enoyl-CoA hydratase-related protein [Ideonella sp. A 288]|uniref:enoyl-CoA hydratase-related protein n=1 Tax=Ideonella sp. A 288 TaxID=1962181 RepID=UPI000B4AEB3D|nr:enoyl-CoA hydratase-related protein [Ideonella sp. A 288]
MRILLLTQAFNGLAQRLFVDLRSRGHTVSVELDISDTVTEEAVARFAPDLVLAPFLKRRIPESVWSRCLCLVVHPGPPGDRGPSALDWTVWRGERDWGVTVLQAAAEFDAGPVWAWRAFAVRPGASKASLYRHEVSQAAAEAVLDALDRVVPGSSVPRSVPALPATPGTWQPLVTAAQRAVDWTTCPSDEVLRRVRSADGSPGVQAPLYGETCRLHDAHAATADTLARAPTGPPGTAVATRGPALLLRTVDGAVWIGHVRRAAAQGQPLALKLAATQAFAAQAAALPELAVPLQRDEAEWDELRYREHGPVGARVGWLEFDFHNGALSERQAARLVDALRQARARDTRVLVLAGGRDFFSNGIHLHAIEAASFVAGDSAADASWRHINAIDDVALEILQTTDRLTVAAMRGNAGAGGCFLALAADQVWAHDGVLLNPHYKNMGNLYGSEYWTYLLPRRVGAEGAKAIMRQRLPQGAREAAATGLIDATFADGVAAFEPQALQRALALAADAGWADAVAAKAARRADDEAAKPLAAYRAEELAQMRRNFYGFDPSYHVARHHFVHRKPHAWTPRHLALHR